MEMCYFVFTCFIAWYAGVAQVVEHITHKDAVPSASLGAGTHIDFLLEMC
jgi:hypothetical protein